MRGVDRGSRVAVATDGLRSSRGEARDALLPMVRMRYGHPVETMTTAEMLDRRR
ncbi:hypothetical protein [Methylobacterium sp. J-070]|uniref:hypothetical protein n=1 Tax=Methylobacterium sp. J-070 TaxID=2836650 RepID=UPI001FB976ED|nr:hypothetical protein [Methylobacterium sp. J-070]MCJ2054237.1 hypothetical protein [Methylobacterium sp. J-070]